VACVGNAVVSHYYYNGFNWKHLDSFDVGTNQRLSVTWNGGAKWRRRIIHKTNHSELGGFVRGWSEFHND